MNILIVGNGFDLSHYLPTKYDHFMDVMRAIEQKDVGGLPKDLDNREISEWLDLLKPTFEKRGVQNNLLYNMTFGDLFSNIRETNFIEKTKEYYQTQEVIIDSKRVIEIHYRLAKNGWYQYFKDHVQEVKTWIDFEKKLKKFLFLLVI